MNERKKTSNAHQTNTSIKLNVKDESSHSTQANKAILSIKLLLYSSMSIEQSAQLTLA